MGSLKKNLDQEWVYIFAKTTFLQMSMQQSVPAITYLMLRNFRKFDSLDLPRYLIQPSISNVDFFLHTFLFTSPL